MYTEKAEQQAGKQAAVAGNDHDAIGPRFRTGEPANRKSAAHNGTRNERKYKQKHMLRDCSACYVASWFALSGLFGNM